MAKNRVMPERFVILVAELLVKIEPFELGAEIEGICDELCEFLSKKADAVERRAGYIASNGQSQK